MKPNNSMMELKTYIAQRIDEAIKDILPNRKSKEESAIQKKKKSDKPRIVDIQKVNFQLRKESDMETESELPSKPSWAAIAAKPKRIATKSAVHMHVKSSSPARKISAQPKMKIPRLAAVSIHCKDPKSYAQVLLQAKRQINLEDIGISEMRR